MKHEAGVLHEAAASTLSTGREEEIGDDEEKGRRREDGGGSVEPRFQRLLADAPAVIGWPGCHGNAIRGSGRSSS